MSEQDSLRQVVDGIHGTDEIATLAEFGESQFPFRITIFVLIKHNILLTSFALGVELYVLFMSSS